MPVRWRIESGLSFEKQPVECQTSAPEEEQRRAELRHKWKNGRRQGNLDRLSVPRRKIVNDAGKQHVKKAFANLIASVRSLAGRQLHLRNGLAAKGTPRHMHAYRFATEHTGTLVRHRSCESAHSASFVLSL